MRNKVRIDFVPGFCVLVLTVVLFGCGGGSSAPLAGYQVPTKSFWAIDFTKSTDTQTAFYKVFANKAGEGSHCYVYVELGKTVSRSAVSAIVNEFDTRIYPSDTATFGDEPNPGIDHDPKIYILLMDIRDNASLSGGYLAGYFFSLNEEPTSVFSLSNQKEMFYMDINPGTPGNLQFYDTLAHEFQHMIHWNQEQLHKGGAEDATWLNEAMSEIAPAYLYGPSLSRVRTFESAPTNSLTTWDSSLTDYGVAYMWSQYFKDRFSVSKPDIFKSMLQNDQVGVASVDAALGELNAQLATSMSFTTTFRDWGIALYSGNTISWPGHPEWSYLTVSAATASLFPATTNTALASFPTPSMGGFAFYSFTPLSLSIGTVTWMAATSGAESAVLIDTLPSVTADLVSGQAYTFTAAGYLIVSNPAGLYSAGTDTITHTSLLKSVWGIEETAVIKTPRAMLAEMNRDPHVKKEVQETGEPVAVCVHTYLEGRTKALKAQGAKPAFVITE